jgi:UDPglucose--hexose-1-phosphate uridylyltransferase
MEHAHSQLIALPIVDSPPRKLKAPSSITSIKSAAFDIVQQESESGDRVVAENEDFITLAPYAPRFPFET